MSEVISEIIPDFSGIIWMAIWLMTIILGAVLALVHEFVLLPKISRMMRKAKWSKAVIAFIQDDTGNVVFTTSDKELPEGVIHNQKGWFLLPRPEAVNVAPLPVAGLKRGPGRPRKETLNPDGSVSVDVVEDQVKPLSPEEIQKNIELRKQMVHVPLLRGLGKQVFFGATNSSMLSNLWTIAHADFLENRRLIPMNTQKTQLDALATYSKIEGTKMMGGDALKILFYVVIAVIPIAVIGLVFWFLKGGA